MDLKVHRLIEKKMSECDLRHALSSSEIDWLLEQIQVSNFSFIYLPQLNFFILMPKFIFYGNISGCY